MSVLDVRERAGPSLNDAEMNALAYAVKTARGPVTFQMPQKLEDAYSMYATKAWSEQLDGHGASQRQVLRRCVSNVATNYLKKPS